MPPSIPETAAVLAMEHKKLWPAECQFKWYWTVPDEDSCEHGPYTSQQMNVWVNWGHTPVEPVRLQVRVEDWLEDLYYEASTLSRTRM